MTAKAMGAAAIQKRNTNIHRLIITAERKLINDI